MQFIYPQLLWALLALAIPIIIHLFHFRRFKKVYFTNVKFLKEIKEEKSTRRQLRNLLVLITRLMAFSFIIFAFAQPYLSKNDTVKTGKNNVSIFIDNSFSMMASSEDVPLMDKARKKAEEIISVYGNGDQFQILSHELKGSQQRWIEKDNTLQAIEEIEFNPEISFLQTVLNKQLQTKEKEGNHIVYLLSDFQKSISEFELPKDSLQEINLVPLQSIKENNVSIDSAWFESVVPALNQNNKLLVSLTNHSDEDLEDVRIQLKHNNQIRPEGTIDIKAQSNKTDTINLLVSEAGWQRLEIEVEDYPVQFDDSYFMCFNIKEKINVLTINQSISEKYISAVFKGLNNFNLTRVNPSSIQYDKLKDYDLILLEDIPSISSGLSSEIKSYVLEGGNLLVFPSANANIETYNNLFNSLNTNTIRSWSMSEKNVHRINTSEFVFENVFKTIDQNLKLPVTTGNYNFTEFNNRPGEYLLKYRNGTNYITKYSREKGNVFVSAAPLSKDYNDLVVNAEVFVPLLYKAAYASTQSKKSSYIIGRDNNTEVSNSSTSEDIIFKIKGEEEFIPGQKNLGNFTLLNFNNMIHKAGYYDIIMQDELIKTIAFNYDRLESKLDYLSQEDLKLKFGEDSNIIENTLSTDLGILIKEKDKGIILWRWCLILALLFLALETCLLRFWKI